MRLFKLTIITIASLIFSIANAVLGPIPIYLNSEYRTDFPAISNIAQTIILDKSAIENTAASTFLELLATIPELNLVNPQGNIPAVFLRGSNSNHTLLLIDGVKIFDVSSPNSAPALDNIPLAQIAKIEIIKGSFSTLYGSGAIGGIISITTKKADGISSFKVSRGSNNSKKISLNVSQVAKNGFINFNVDKYQTDGISALANNTEKDGIDSLNIGVKIGLSVKKTDLILGISNFKIDTEYDDNFGNNHDKISKKALVNLNFSIKQKFKDNIKSHLSFSQINQQKDFFTDSFSNSKYTTKDLSLLTDISLENALLTIGLSKITDTNISTNQALSTEDIFAQWQQNFTHFELNSGIRFINHSDFGSETIFNLAAAKTLNNGIKLTANLGSAFNAPSIFQSNYGATKNLKPETSKSLEFGISKNHNWGFSAINFYQTKVKNIIEYGGKFPADFYYNQTKSTAKGVDLTAKTSIKGYNLNLSHNFVSAKIEGQQDQQLRRPKNTTSLGLAKTIGKFKSRLNIVKKSSLLDVANVKVPGYILANLSTQYQHKKDLKFSLSINNLFNKTYQTIASYNQPKRQIIFSIMSSF